jgi:hypothetical protein
MLVSSVAERAAYAASPRDRFGEIKRSAEIRHRSRSLLTMDMLNSRLRSAHIIKRGNSHST